MRSFCHQSTIHFVRNFSSTSVDSGPDMTKVQTPLGERLQRRRVVIEMVIDMENFCELPCFGLERHGKDVSMINVSLIYSQIYIYIYTFLNEYIKIYMILIHIYIYIHTSYQLYVYR